MREKLCGIYCIENTINNKKYIGMSRDISRRWYEHKTELKNNSHDNKYLQSSWGKYGKDKFKFYVLEICSEELLSDRECYYIVLYKSLSHKNGYNLTSGGENTSIGKRVISLTDMTVYNLVKDAASCNLVTSITMINWCKNKQNFMYLDEFNSLSVEEQNALRNVDWKKIIHEKISKSHSAESLSNKTRKKLKDATSGKNNPRSIRVYCPQLNEHFDYIKSASKKYGINNGSISQCIKGKLKSAGSHPVTGERLTWELS